MADKEFEALVGRRMEISELAAAVNNLKDMAAGQYRDQWTTKTATNFLTCLGLLTNLRILRSTDSAVVWLNKPAALRAREVLGRNRALLSSKKVFQSLIS